MRFEGVIGRVEKLEAEVYGGQTPTTYEAGRLTWLTGSGLHTAFQILKIQHDSGEEDLSPDTLPAPLREEVSSWSRAETVGQGRAAAMVKEMCIQIMRRRPES